MDLTYESGVGIYLAPIQMQANNGLLVIDDFGRQTITPEALLNRWIVPLDRRLDYLSLSYGVRFDIPFDVKVVFSTNLDPATLGDEAFYRRIQNKILVSSISDAEFDEVLFRSADAAGITIAPGADRLPPPGQPRPRRRRPAPVPAQGGLQDPPGRVHLQPGAAGARQRRGRPGGRRSTSPGPARSGPRWRRPPWPTRLRRRPFPT